MTIKKRINISNIFMIIIPVTICLFVGLFILTIGYFFIKNNQGIGFDIENFYSSKEVIISQIEESLNESNPINKLNFMNNMLDSKQMRIKIDKDHASYYEFGNQSKDDNYLISLTNNSEIFSIVNNRQVYHYIYTNDSSTYDIFLFCNVKKASYHTIKEFLIILFAILLFSIVISVFFTNYFLTKFVYKKVEQPLNLLLNGAKEIANGNYTYYIHYDEENEFKEIIDQFNFMATSLNSASIKEKEHLKNKQMLIAGISHDIKSPLTSIKGYVEGILDGVANTPLKIDKYLNIIKRKCLEIDNLIKQMINISKNEYLSDIEENSIITLSKNFINENKEFYNQQKLIIKENFIDDFHLKLSYVDYCRLISNIIDNSLKYNLDKEVVVSITTKIKQNKCYLIIEDNGIGVKKENIPYLFEPFYRGDLSRTNPENGSGLGLAIVKKIVDSLNGNIYANNVNPHGLMITIEFKKEN